MKGKRPLKADEILAERSAVPAIAMRKRPGDKTTDGVADAKRQRVSYISHKELTRLRQIADGHQTKSLVEVKDAIYDPWDEQVDAHKLIVDPKFSFLEKPEEAKPPKTLKHKPISLTASGKAVPAVLMPQGGYSYNPKDTDYDQRLLTEGEREVIAEQKRLATIEAERIAEEARNRSAKEAEAAEARGDLSEWEEDSAWEGFESGAEDIKLNAKRPERKTQVQRNKIKRRKQAEREAKMAADIKRKNDQVAEMKKIAKAVAARDAERALALKPDNDSSSEEDNDLELRRRQLGKMKLPERDLELVLPDELQDSLRLLKPEGNLLKDRYRSLLVRGKMESRRKIPFHKQKNVKATEKWNHKDWQLF